MVATHYMKVNGRIYLPGEDVASPGEKPVKPVEEKTEEKIYTKSGIMTMKASDLRELAGQSGIENADEYTGSELKKMLIEKFDL